MIKSKDSADIVEIL